MSEVDEKDLLTRADVRVGTVIKGKYRIDSVLGVGGMATVFAVTHSNSQRFALKLLHPELAILESVRKRFVREGYAANNVHHEGVVAIFDNDEDETGAPFLLMELLEGKSVSALCQPPLGPLPIRESLGIVVRLLDVLSSAHKQGIIHRDIKPSNLFLTNDGRLKVLDFGIAQLRESALELTQTRTGTTLGTPSFMAPEQARAKTGDVDARTDIWAVGATLFTMLSGKFVHEGENPTHIRVIAATESARSLASVAPDIPAQVVHIVDKALAFDKESRFESADVMRDAVQGVLSDFYGAFSPATLATFVKSVSSPGKTATGEDASERKSRPTEIELSQSENKIALRPASGLAKPSGSIPRPIAPARKKGRIGTLIAGFLTLMGILAAAFFLMRNEDKAAAPKVTVFASTDMSVPADFNWVGFTVKGRDGNTIQSGAVTVSDWKQLPARLIELATSAVQGTVRIDVEARRGGENGKLVVEREVQFEMPDAGEKILSIPLDLLCAEDMSPPHCKAGKQCAAGECIDIAPTDAEPVSPKPTDEADCFHAAQCFTSALQITIPENEPSIGPCVIKKSPVFSYREQANLGLVVNTSAVGNYGVCGPTGQCIVPLGFGGPSGWELAEERGKIVGVRLPAAVCRAVGLNRLSGVAIAPATLGCPPKSAKTPLCADALSCTVKEGICPRDFPPAWIGYTCKGASSPQMIRTDLLWCLLPQSRADAADDALSRGEWCCTTGERPSEDPLLIDDMSGGPQIKHRVRAGYTEGYWWTSSDAVQGEFSPPLTPYLFTYRTISPPVTVEGDRTFDRAACFKSSSGFSGWYASMGLAFMFETGTTIASAIDLSPYTGMRFWGVSQKGEQKIAVRISDKDTYTEDPHSTCNQNPKAGKCGDDFGVHNLVLTPEWKEYTVKWDDFIQDPQDWGQARFDSFDRTRAYHAYFAVSGRGPKAAAPPFEFCISQIYFTR